ncbi:MAG: DUF805 domain-containing protein [Halopseudomonas sp.]|uniref:DUF805 domain-containing protein n=1 Tax=Halopseudomonas sp. TaxID=2901191 RepID=UPI0030021D49
MERIEPVFSHQALDASGLLSGKARAKKSCKVARPSVLEMEGRLSLANYWLYHATFNLDAFMLCYAAAYFLLRHNPAALLLSIGTLFMLNCWISLALVLRRTRDTGRSAWWCWLIVLPLIGELFMLYLALKPGQDEPNRAGRPNQPYPRTEYGKIALLAILNSILVVLLLITFRPQIADASRILFAAFLNLFS